MRSYAAGPSSTPLLDETIGATFRRAATAFGGNDALVDVASGRRWTYSELAADVDAVAKGLVHAGIQAGDRIGIWAPNCPEWVVVQVATARVGAILVTINPAYRTRELEFALKQSGTRWVFAVRQFKTSEYDRMLSECRSEVPSLEHVVFFDSVEWVHLLSPCTPQDDEMLAERDRELHPSDPVNIQYTSGTTGIPKGATLSHANILNNGFFTTELIGITSRDRLAVPVPFYHCFGMVMANLGCISHGATIVIPSVAFDPEAALLAIERERCTAVYGVPTMFVAMLRAQAVANRDLSTLRTGIMAGSPCPVEVMRRCISEMHMSEVAIAYGMTETSPVSCQTSRHDDLTHRTESVGRAHPHVEIKVIDPDTGETVERGTPGEFCTRGYSVMLGYWGEPSLTAEAIDRDGWMHSGDLAVMQEDGYCAIVGRIKDMVIRGGENIYPREVEEFLFTHPDIEDVQVVGVPDADYGEELCAWVRMRPGAPAVDAVGIAAFADGRLARFKIPRYVIVVEDFPLTVTGKVRKVEMRQRSSELLGLRDSAR
ncbi:MAG: AMP-binding protein [Actinomycetota bacterium]|nr:AMP-binding protein [Actinomycetota bacterium]